MPLIDGGPKKPWIFTEVKNGRIRYWDKEANEEKTPEAAVGAFVNLEFKDDPGNATVRPHKVFMIDLDDGECVIRLSYNSYPSTFARCIAKYLPNVRHGQQVKIKCWPGTNNEKVTVALIESLDENGEWIRVEAVPFETSIDPKADELVRREQTAKQDAEADARIKNHPSYNFKVTETPDGESAHTVTVFGIPFVPSKPDSKPNPAVAKSVADAALLIAPYDAAHECLMQEFLTSIGSKEDATGPEGGGFPNFTTGVMKSIGRFLREHSDTYKTALASVRQALAADPYADDD